MQNETILVIGSTGKTGRRIAGKLADLGYAVRHGSRRSSTPFDWEKPGTWNAALAGVQAAYISYLNLVSAGHSEKEKVNSSVS